MGFILSKFRRKKPATKDLLENIDKELRDIQRFQIDTELRQKRIIGRIILLSSGFYLIAAIAFYFLAPRGLKWQETVKYVSPFIAFPPIIYGLKRFVAWYYEQKIVKKKERYSELKKEKQRILEDVMDNETFKVGKEILEKYAPGQLMPKHLVEQLSLAQMSPMAQNQTPMQRHQQQQQQQRQIMAGTPTTSRQGFDEGLRRRQLQLQGRGPTSTPIRPNQQQQFQQQQQQQQRQGYNRMSYQSQYGPTQFSRQPTNNAFFRPMLAIAPSPTSNTPQSAQSVRFRPPPPAYMLPLPPANPVVHNRATGWMDKLVEYFIGDGPSNRYALICRYCATNNGLATAEDFPYIGFRCVYCSQFNPPRQVRPAAPKLPTNTVLIEELESTIKSESTKSPNVSNEDGEEIEGGKGSKNNSTDTTPTKPAAKNEDGDDDDNIVEGVESKSSDVLLEQDNNSGDDNNTSELNLGGGDHSEVHGHVEEADGDSPEETDRKLKSRANVSIESMDVDNEESLLSQQGHQNQEQLEEELAQNLGNVNVNDSES